MNHILTSNTTARSSYSPGHFTVDQTLFVQKLHKPSGTFYPIRFSLGGWDATGEGRIVHQGPMVKGPYLFGFTKATVMSDDRKGSGWEHAEGLKAGTEIEVQHGDTVELDGKKYLVAITGYNSDKYIHFTRIVESFTGPENVTTFIFEDVDPRTGDKTGTFTVSIRDDDSGEYPGVTKKIPTLEAARQKAREWAGLDIPTGKANFVTI